jgi:hypothetical protein
LLEFNNMDQQITLSIILEKPTAGVDYALQKGSGNNYEVVQKQRSEAKDLYFEFTITVKSSKNPATPDFRGPIVQGPVNGRFVYIDIGTYAGQADSVWSRRLKIPLSGISFEIIKKLISNSKAILEAKVPGVGKDGGPNCATVKPFEGWKIKLE